MNFFFATAPIIIPTIAPVPPKRTAPPNAFSPAVIAKVLFMETKKFTRKELYDLVWSTSRSKLTSQYAFSNEGLKKLCKQFEIPMPDNGYWMKLKFNKEIEKPKFNTLFDGEDKIILTIREDGNLVNIDQSPLTIRTKEILSDPKSPLIVPERLSNPDILIQNTITFHDKRKNNHYYRNEKIDTVSIYVVL